MTETVSNLLSLEEWRERMQINPWLFWGLSNSRVPPLNDCQILQEYGWQMSDRTGREQVRQAIVEAERKLKSYLGFEVAPRYQEAEIAYPRPNDQSLWYGSGASDSTARRLSVQLPDGYVQALGVESLTLRDTPSVGAGTMVYSDQDGDGLLDTLTITATVPAGTSADSLAVYVPAADRLDGEGRSERYRLRPIRASVSNVTATIIVRSWLCVRPILYQGYTGSTQGINPDTTSNYLQSCEVCTRTTNGDGTTTATAQGVFTWETLPWPAWASCCDAAPYIPDSSTDPAAIGQAIARVGLRDARHGLVTPGQAVYNSTTGLWGGVVWFGCRQPDRVTVRYLAGVPLESGRVAAQWADVVAGFAAAELQRGVCSCDAANAQLYYLQTDLARTGGNAGDQYSAVSAQDLNSPFGTRRGHVRAWRAVRHLRQLRSFLP